MAGIRVDTPRMCDICDKDVGPSWDIHMILQHPETRPQPVIALKTTKGKKKKK